jgi:hypothetical protein
MEFDAEQGASRRRSITAPLHTLIANILGQRKLTGGCTAKDIQITEVLVLKYECMGALKEYHWDAKGSTYGSLLIRIGEGDMCRRRHIYGPRASLLVTTEARSGGVDYLRPRRPRAAAG